MKIKGELTLAGKVFGILSDNKIAEVKKSKLTKLFDSIIPEERKAEFDMHLEKLIELEAPVVSYQFVVRSVNAKGIKEYVAAITNISHAGKFVSVLRDIYKVFSLDMNDFDVMDIEGILLDGKLSATKELKTRTDVISNYATADPEKWSNAFGFVYGVKLYKDYTVEAYSNNPKNVGTKKFYTCSWIRPVIYL